MVYDDLLKGRWSIRYQYYLVTFTTRDRAPMFRDLHLARLVVAELRNLQRAGLATSVAWVIMPDHVHWLFQLHAESNMSRVVKLLKGRSARTINVYRSSKGSVWQSGFQDRAIRREGSLRLVARYIVANPLRAGLVTAIGDYPHWDSIWLGDRLEHVLVE